MPRLKYMDEDYAGFGEMNVQSDWNQTDSTKDDYIKNKPNIEEVTITGTTTSTGALEIPTALRPKYLVGLYRDGSPATLIYRRDIAYLTVMDQNTLVGLSNTNVTVKCISIG